MVVTRFAPSPTGYLHIGAVRTALFAWLIARQNNGAFILRIEDTDKKREVSGAIDHIKESLLWLGLDWDEGGSEEFIQSNRLDIYHKYAQKLVDESKAYADTTTPAQLTSWREQARAQKRPFHFNDHRPSATPEWKVGLPLRLKIEATNSPAWHDEIRGPQKPSSENIDDFVLIKADGYPTYNFAHIVDDHEMSITHVIRGEEFVSSMPKYLMLYEALGVTPPKFAHVPNILAPTGNRKLSKRDGAPDLLQYRDRGYQPDAILNFLAKLGWNDGTEQEVYSRDELIAKFDLDRIQKAPARYDEKQLEWISGHHIRRTPLDDLYGQVQAFWSDHAQNSDAAYRKQVLSLIHERLKHFDELPALTDFFFIRPQFKLADLMETDKQLRKLDFANAKTMLSKVIQEIETAEWSESMLEEQLRALVETLDVKAGILFKLIRVSVTGQHTAPGLFETMATLGKDETLARLQSALSTI